MKEAKVLWIDFLANGARLHIEEKRTEYIDKAKKAGFTHIVVDAKIPYGYVTYKSKLAPHAGDWERFSCWRGLDYVAVMLEEIKKQGLKAILKADIFAEGRIGTPALPQLQDDWQVIYLGEEEDGRPVFTKAEDWTENAVFVNPVMPDVRQYELSIIRELGENYEFDAFILDRCRYPNVKADYSPLSRREFEKYSSHSIKNWPYDVAEGGPFFKKWLAWRASVISSFIKEAKAEVKKAGSSRDFGVYVGSWYPEFFQEGVNWGSREFNPGYDWMDSDYSTTGYAEELDFIMTGCYCFHVTKQEASAAGLREWQSVEGAIEISKAAVMNKPAYLPSLFLKDYEGEEQQFQKALEMCAKNGESLMIFDSIYLEQYGWWDLLKEHNLSRGGSL
ncbi:family 10 glycosylhydrolase [Bacillus infantis]|uniref:Family 10 glycosylhydrolase n=1 Tax=Bacillus infantis TaxID=324767 RepID=A0A5D4SNT3_9BACI|nr:alpha amylase family protein [Bacillus infantis]TYS63878.1 family 10 glycosylhydrolase [Bacillus infantis]